MPPKRMFTEVQEQAIAATYLDGTPSRDLAEQYSCDRKTITNIVHRHSGRMVWGDTAGPSSRNWRGGRIVTRRGYIVVYVALDDSFAIMRSGNGNYILEHRLVMAQHLGRPLLPGETVHHINGDRSDNRLSNLQLRVGNHGAGAALACLDCGSHRIGPGRIAETDVA